MNRREEKKGLSTQVKKGERRKRFKVSEVFFGRAREPIRLELPG